MPAALPRKLHVVAFGCQMSAADGDEMARPLLARGMTAVRTAAEADAIILNTCTVRQHAEDRAVSYLGRLREWKAERPDALLIVAGCAAERLGGWIQKRFPYVDLVVGARSIEQYPGILEEALRKRFDWTEDNSEAWPKENKQHETLSPALPLRGREAGKVAAYLTVMRGCNYTCTYCIVPAVRGRELYRPMELLLEEARRLADEGAREIMLLGQTVNSYRAGESDFSDLLRAMAAVPGVERIRFMSPHPHFVTPRLIETMAELPQVCPHIHLPLQSGSDRMLKRMRRNYTAEAFLEKAEALRRAIPGIAITTDVIAGFPGETDADFEETLSALSRLDPASAYCFAFSPREGTEAESYPDAVPDAARGERLARLLRLTESRQQAHLEAWVGRRVRVLLEDERHGRTDHAVRAKLEAPGEPGTVVEAEVVRAVPQGLAVRKIAPHPSAAATVVAACPNTKQEAKSKLPRGRGGTFGY